MINLPALIAFALLIQPLLTTPIIANEWVPIVEFNEFDPNRPTARLGFSSAKFENTIALGSTNYNFGPIGPPMLEKGGVYIYHQISKNNWKNIKLLVGDNSMIGDMFGDRLKLNGNLLVVDSRDAIYLYERNNGGENNWGRTKKISNGPSHRELLAASNNIIITSQRNKVIVYQRNFGGLNNWGKMTELTMKENNFIDGTGSIFGDTVVIGLFSQQEDSGFANVYQVVGGTDNKLEFITSLKPEFDNYSHAGAWIEILDNTIALSIIKYTLDINTNEEYLTYGFIIYERNNVTNNWTQSYQQFSSIGGPNHTNASLSGNRLATLTFNEEHENPSVSIFEKTSIDWKLINNFPIDYLSKIDFDDDSILITFFGRLPLLYAPSISYAVPSMSQSSVFGLIFCMLLIASYSFKHRQS